MFKQRKTWKKPTTDAMVLVKEKMIHLQSLWPSLCRRTVSWEDRLETDPLSMSNGCTRTWVMWATTHYAECLRRSRPLRMSWQRRRTMSAQRAMLGKDLHKHLRVQDWRAQSSMNASRLTATGFSARTRSSILEPLPQSARSASWLAGNVFWPLWIMPQGTVLWESWKARLQRSSRRE